MCAAPHTTLTIPVDPGPGPDLTQIHINPQPFQWGYGDVRSEFGRLRWLSCGRWALAKERCNGSCKHQDCSQQLCNLQLHCFTERFTKGNGLHGSRAPPMCHHRDPVLGPPILNAGGGVSEITNENSVSLHKRQ